MKNKFLGFIAWAIPILIGVGLLYITFAKISFDVKTWADYLNVAYSAKLSNLILFYGSLYCFDWIIPPKGSSITTILESSDAWKFICVLTISTAYVLGLT